MTPAGDCQAWLFSIHLVPPCPQPPALFCGGSSSLPWVTGIVSQRSPWLQAPGAALQTPQGGFPSHSLLPTWVMPSPHWQNILGLCIAAARGPASCAWRAQPSSAAHAWPLPPFPHLTAHTPHSTPSICRAFSPFCTFANSVLLPGPWADITPTRFFLAARLTHPHPASASSYCCPQSLSWCPHSLDLPSLVTLTVLPFHKDVADLYIVIFTSMSLPPDWEHLKAKTGFFLPLCP